MTGGNETVFSRWSRRKHQSRLTAPTDEDHGPEAEPEDAGRSARHSAWRDEARATASDEAGELVEDVAPEADAEPEMLSEEDLPDIDSLTYESDFSMFLQNNVPGHLHRLAMRKLWRTDPVLANVDGLNDYDLDYTIEEAMDVARQSAEDLARGSKRLNVSGERAREREAKREERQRQAVTGRAEPMREAAAAKAETGVETGAEAGSEGPDGPGSEEENRESVAEQDAAGEERGRG